MSGDLDMVLHPETWPPDDHLDVMFLGRALDQLASHDAFKDEDLASVALRALVDGSLVAVIIARTGSYLTIPSARWRLSGRALLYSCSIGEGDVASLSGVPEWPSAIMAIDYRRQDAREIYITRSSLSALLGASERHATTRRGPRPIKMDRVVAAMRLIDREVLRSMKEKNMEEQFRASRTLCRDARNAVLEPLQTPPNDK